MISEERKKKNQCQSAIKQDYRINGFSIPCPKKTTNFVTHQIGLTSSCSLTERKT